MKKIKSNLKMLSEMAHEGNITEVFSQTSTLIDDEWSYIQRDNKGGLVHNSLLEKLWKRVFSLSYSLEATLKAKIKNLIFRPKGFGMTYTKRWKFFELLGLTSWVF